MSDRQNLINEAIEKIMEYPLEEDNLALIREGLEKLFITYSKNDLEYIIYGE